MIKSIAAIRTTDGSRFELGPDDQISINLRGVCGVLGSKVEVCAEMERFLIQVGHSFALRFLGRSFADWEGSWAPAGKLIGDFSKLRKSVGLYRAEMDGKIMYVGKACEHKNGGLSKRLADYKRKSDSARMTGAGPEMYRNRYKIEIFVLVTGSSASAAHAAEQMERLFIEKYDPPWNTHSRKGR